MTTQNQSSFARILVAGVFGFMFGAGYAIATNHEGSSKMAIPDVAHAQIAEPTVYFPAQDQNQAKVAEDHIQAF